MSVQTIPESVASDLGLVAGVELAKVTSGTPAAKAGLHGSTGTKQVDGDAYPTGGDVITEIDGQKRLNGRGAPARDRLEAPWRHGLDHVLA